MTAAHILGLFALGIAGMSGLSITMARYARHFGAISARWGRWPLRLGSSLLLGAATITSAAIYGWGIGLVYLFGILTIAAIIVVNLLTYRPQWLLGAAVLATLTSQIFLILIIYSPR
jgi:hypothetical protein